MDKFAAKLKARIENQYRTGGYQLGWRLLYSPASLADARVAFIGLNPGGNEVPNDHAKFAMEAGSAYACESWGPGIPPGQSKLQRQVLALFEMAGQRPDAVLAGNLVPFRSPSWSALPNRDDALAFGKSIWTDILAEVKPQLVLAMGRDVELALVDVLGVRTMESVPLSWGNISGRRGSFAYGTLICITHLSRYAVITRPASQQGLTRLLSPSSN